MKFLMGLIGVFFLINSSHALAQINCVTGEDVGANVQGCLQVLPGEKIEVNKDYNVNIIGKEEEKNLDEKAYKYVEKGEKNGKEDTAKFLKTDGEWEETKNPEKYVDSEAAKELRDFANKDLVAAQEYGDIQ